MPGVSGIVALADWLCLSPMRLPLWIPAVQRTIPVCPMPPSGLGDGRDRTAEDPHAAFYDGSEIHSDIAVTSRRWNAIPMSTNPTILILAFSIDCTSSSVSPRRLFWAPITSAGKDRKATSDGRSLIREGDYVAICA